MKLAIVSAHAKGDVDPTLSASLLRYIPHITSVHEADTVLVVVAHHGDYQFNTTLRNIRKPVVIIDMLEYFGFAAPGVTHLLGRNELPINMRESPQWQSLHDWLAQSPPRIYFKRELLEKDRGDFVLPIEWPCTLPAWEIEPKDRFDVRPFGVIYSWGYSNAIRPRMASEIYGLMAEGKIEVIASWDHIDAKQHEPQHKWLSIHCPHTHRLHINEIMRRQAQSKMSISLPGSGVVCFRSVEAPLHTVPVMVQDDRAWSHPWTSGYNCIRLDASQNMASQLWHHVTEGASDLHGIYVNAQETIDRYRSSRYLHEYFLPSIAKSL